MLTRGILTSGSAILAFYCDGAGLGQLTAFTVAKAVCRMVINHAGRLHSGIHNGRADEGETTFFHILAEPIRNWCVGGDTGG